MMGLVTPISVANVTFRFQRFACSYLLPVWVARSGTEAFEPFCASVVWECLISIHSTAFGKGVVDFGFASFVTRCRSIIRVVDDCEPPAMDQNPNFASKFCGFTGQVHSVLQYLWLKCLDHSFEFSDTEYDLHSTKCILSTFDPHFNDWKEILSQPRELCWCFRMVLPCLRNWSASMFNLGWVSPVRQLLRTLSLMVQPRHWVVWLRRLDVGGYASLVRWITSIHTGMYPSIRENFGTMNLILRYIRDEQWQQKDMLNESNLQGEFTSCAVCPPVVGASSYHGCSMVFYHPGFRASGLLFIKLGVLAQKS